MRALNYISNPDAIVNLQSPEESKMRTTQLIDKLLTELLFLALEQRLIVLFI